MKDLFEGNAAWRYGMQLPYINVCHLGFCLVMCVCVFVAGGAPHSVTGCRLAGCRLVPRRAEHGQHEHRGAHDRLWAIRWVPVLEKQAGVPVGAAGRAFQSR